MKEFCQKLFEKNDEEMKACLQSMIDYLGYGFHPDNDACDYVHPNGGEEIFTKEECSFFDRNLARLFEFYGEAVYDMSNMLLGGKLRDIEPKL